MLNWRAHTGPVTSLAFVPGGGLISIGLDGYFMCWDHLRAEEQFSYHFVNEPCIASPAGRVRPQLLVDRTGQFAAVCHPNAGVDLVTLPQGEIGFADIRFRPLYSIAPHPSGDSFLAVGRRDWTSMYVRGEIEILEVRFRDGEILAQSCTPPQGNRLGLAVHPSGSEVLCGWTRYAWPSGQIQELPSLTSGSLFVTSPDGDKLFGLNGKRLVVWGFQTGALRHRFKGHLAPITGLALTPNGQKLWTGSLDATVRQWNVETCRCEKCYRLGIGPLGCIAISPDGLTAAAGSAHNGQIAVWDLE